MSIGPDCSLHRGRPAELAWKPISDSPLLKIHCPSRRAFLKIGVALGLSAFTLSSPLQSLAARSAGNRLRITGFRTLLVNNIPPYLGAKQWLFIQLQTNEGLVGIGERPTGWMPDLTSQVQLLHEMCERFVVGRSPFDIEAIWHGLYASMHDYRHPGLYGTPALSAIEMACWDLVGKAAQQPVYNLLGGRVHDRLRAYSYLDAQGVWEDPSLGGKKAAALLSQGVSACKLDPFVPARGGPQDFSLEQIRHVASIFRAIRDAVGDKMEIGIGTHGQFSTSGAIRVASILEEFHPYFFEEPVSPENVDEMARVAAQTTIPIATGERLVTKYEFAQVLQKQAASIIQLDVGQCGGILESKKIAAMSEAHYAMLAPHMYCGPVALAAAVQLDTCCQNFMIQEYNTTALHADILVEPLSLAGGFITPPTAPGLGVELNEKVVKRVLAS
jgi:galactonate dehydratase